MPPPAPEAVVGDEAEDAVVVDVLVLLLLDELQAATAIGTMRARGIRRFKVSPFNR
jgi:hypothetical protein